MTISAFTEGHELPKMTATSPFRETHIGDVFVQEAVGALLVVAHKVFMALRFEPRAQAELHMPDRIRHGSDDERTSTDLVLDSAQETRLLLCGVAALVEDGEDLHVALGLLVEGRSVAEAGRAGQRAAASRSKSRRTHLAWTAPVRARANIFVMERLRRRG